MAQLEEEHGVRKEVERGEEGGGGERGLRRGEHMSILTQTMLLLLK